MKTLKIEPSLHNLLKRKALELDQTITVLANRWMTMGAYYEGHIASFNGAAVHERRKESPSRGWFGMGCVHGLRGVAESGAWFLGWWGGNWSEVIGSQRASAPRGQRAMLALAFDFWELGKIRKFL